MTTDQVVRYAEVGGRTVAWSEVGDGPALVVGGWWCSHLAVDWLDELFRRFTGTLAERHRVIRYDRPGSGLSDRDGPSPRTREEEVDVLVGLADAIGLDTMHVLGASSGAVVAAATAAAHPDRVERLVISGGYAHGADVASPSARAAMVDVVRRHWGLGSRMLADVFMPGASAQERAAFATYQRQVTPAESAAAELELVYAHDARDVLEAIRSPTLVMHRRDDRAIPFALGQDLAARIPGARSRRWRGPTTSRGGEGEPRLPGWSLLSSPARIQRRCRLPAGHRPTRSSCRGESSRCSVWWPRGSPTPRSPSG